MVELWTGRVHLLTPPSEVGDTKCYTNVVAWAQSSDDFVRAISSIFEKSSCYVLDVEDCERIDDCMNITEALEGQIERAKIQPEDCIFGTLHYYPSKPA
jgi:hypothetical protein